MWRLRSVIFSAEEASGVVKIFRFNQNFRLSEDSALSDSDNLWSLLGDGLQAYWVSRDFSVQFHKFSVSHVMSIEHFRREFHVTHLEMLYIPHRNHSAFPLQRHIY